MASDSGRPKAPGETGYGAEHYEQLGRLMAEFTSAEIAFHLAFRFYSEMPIAEARLLFGNTRTEDIIEKTKLLMRLHKAPDALQNDFYDLQRQFDTIRRARNRLMHWQFTFLHRHYRLSDIALARRIEDAQNDIRYSIEDLKSMGADLRYIWKRINHHHINPNPDMGAFEPWQYKSPQPEGRRARRG
jgi:hypothetical protein